MPVLSSHSADSFGFTPPKPVSFKDKQLIMPTGDTNKNPPFIQYSYKPQPAGKEATLCMFEDWKGQFI